MDELKVIMELIELDGDDFTDGEVIDLIHDFVEHRRGINLTNHLDDVTIRIIETLRGI